MTFSSVRGQRVALVGNSADGLKRRWGGEIDAHDVVVRMNAGAPASEHFGALGKRTSILSVGTKQSLQESLRHLDTIPEVWWVKSTKLGRRQRREVMEGGIYPVDFPSEWIDAAQAAVGHKPSGGICLILGLIGPMEVSELSVFNVDFFGELGAQGSWWHTERPKAKIMSRCPHDGAKELAVFKKLGFTEREPGWWIWTNSSGG